MIRTQVYITEEEKEALNQLSAATGKPQSELIREAIDGLIARNGERHRKAVIAARCRDVARPGGLA